MIADFSPKIRKIYVDGYNLLFFLHPNPSLSFDALREELAQTIRQYSKKINIPIHLIFDGKEGGRYPGMTFTAGKTADEELIHIAQKHQGSTKILFVSSDREVQQKISSCKIEVMASNAFWRLIQMASKTNKKIVEEPLITEIDSLLQEFSGLDHLLQEINDPIPTKLAPAKNMHTSIPKPKAKKEPIKSFEISTDKDHLPSEEEIDFWMKEFGFED